MNYRTGEIVKLWDRVRMDHGSLGLVVFCIDVDEYSPAFPKKDWAYLKRGAMVATDDMGLVHFAVNDEEMDLLGRGGPPSAEEWAAFERACARQGGAGPPSSVELATGMHGQGRRENGQYY